VREVIVVPFPSPLLSRASDSSVRALLIELFCSATTPCLSIPLAVVAVLDSKLARCSASRGSWATDRGASASCGHVYRFRLLLLLFSTQSSRDSSASYGSWATHPHRAERGASAASCDPYLVPRRRAPIDSSCYGCCFRL
jgi:hypothetical protein